MVQVRGGVVDSSAVRLTDRISLGVLAEVFPRDVIEDVLNETGRRELRSRLLPAHVVVRFCLGMCLFFDDDYEEVMRKLVGSLRSVGSWRGEWNVPSTAAISKARKRLGVEPLSLLFERVAVPVAGRGTTGAWLASRRLMAMDGFSVDVPDTPENAAEFGRQRNQSVESAFPRALMIVLGECGSRAIVGAAIAGCLTSEKTLARDIIGSVEPDMLVIADRGFYGFDLWNEFRRTGADLLWRVSSAVTLPVLEWLPDGSYRSILVSSAVRRGRRDRLIEKARRGEDCRSEDAQPVRVVEYQVPDRAGDGAAEVVCVVTSILDPAEATAMELALAYHERWECEGLIDEMKTHQQGSGKTLRSRSPDMVRQELWAFLLAHYGIRRLMCSAADEADVDPDRLSFMRSLRVIRRQVPAEADFSP
ncbi:IS4 family transposase [Actinokineospora auranticolor]|uniref:IS4 family transposase n=1 Tax=Actinokineospora auranticolor TaxID=155976 RepID=UPI0035A86B27